jgi:hypothetical protein
MTGLRLARQPSQPVAIPGSDWYLEACCLHGAPKEGGGIAALYSARRKMTHRQAFSRFLGVMVVCGIPAALNAEPPQAPVMTRWASEVSQELPWPEYPRPQMVRPDWQNLNGQWEYAVAAKSAKRPGDWTGKILVPFPFESALSGVMKRIGPDQRLWYRRTFTIPDEAAWSGKRVLLHFGAVDWEATVYVNKKQVGVHRGGYDPFTFDITDSLKRKGENELLVAVWDPTDSGPQPRGKQVSRPEGIYYTPTTGIWQTVWLEPVNRGHIRGTRFEFEEAKRGTSEILKLRFIIDVVGLKKPSSVYVKASLPSRVSDGLPIQATWTRAGDDAYTVLVTGDIPKPRPAQYWSPENPRLFDYTVFLADGEQEGEPKPETVIDTVSSYYAVRKVTVGPDKDGVTRLMLNGEPLFQFGLLDQGFWPDGLYTPPTDEAMKYDIEMTRRWGFNMIRKHVKVEPARWYYHCDKIGLLVWQDMPSGEASVAAGAGEMKRSKASAAIFETELKAMIDSLRWSPSIVMWVPFNEGWGQYDTVRITKWVKQYDPTRWVNSASGWNDFRVGDVHDIHVYPGPASPEPESRRAAVLGEFGGLGLPLRGHTWQAEGNWGYRAYDSPEKLQDAYLDLIDRLHPLIGKPGLSAAVYTQTTDVEVEVNGLMTYDREVHKIPTETLAEAHAALFDPPPTIRTVVETSRKEAQTWRYTFDKPSDAWLFEAFDDGDWKSGPGGFGEPSTPGSVVRTEWKTQDIWLRRTVTIPPDVDLSKVRLSIHHDEDATIYINGVLAASVSGYTTDYRTARLTVNPLRHGENVIAVHCQQTGGGQYIDVGVVELKAPENGTD